MYTHAHAGKCDEGKIATAERNIGRFNLTLEEHMELPWVLSKDQLKTAQQLVSQLSVPSYLDFNPKKLFTHLSHLKSHDWKQACQIHMCMTTNLIYCNLIGYTYNK